jgi:hypothetical protein
VERGKAERHVCSCRICQDDRLSATAEWHRALNEAIYHAAEKHKRLVAGLEALQAGWGGITAISAITGMDRRTISRGIRDLHAGDARDVRNREPGGGRKKVEKQDAGILPLLKGLMKDEVGGDPISGVRWTRKSTRALAQEMGRQGRGISRGTVGRLLKEMGFPLRANAKTLSGPRHPDRETHFIQIGKKLKSFEGKGAPILSVDTKKTEIIANYANAGHIWRRQAIDVSDHDFPQPELGRAVPFGIYDLGRNQGRVVVGTSAQTASFGVDALWEWYRRDGRRVYPDAEDLLILCDNGGCNGSKNRLWKYELQRFADQSGLTIHVAHYPPGASKWNPIEHRLFSFISKNWAGQPLNSYERVLNFLRTTKTRTGLSVRANLLSKRYEKGMEISDEQLSDISLHPGRVLSRWNYTIRARQN